IRQPDAQRCGVHAVGTHIGPEQSIRKREKGSKVLPCELGGVGVVNVVIAGEWSGHDWATAPNRFEPGLRLPSTTKYTSPVTNRVLLEGGFAAFVELVDTALAKPAIRAISGPSQPAAADLGAATAGRLA